VSTFLRERRLSRALSAEQLADQLGVHPASVLRWERRERLPGPRHIHGLASSLAVDPAAVARFFDEARTPTAEPPSGLRAPGLRELRSAARLPAPARAVPAAEHPLRRLRRRTGLSQSVVAERIGVSRHSVSAWERGQVAPLGAVRRLSSVYGVPVAAVARAAGVAPPPLLDPRAWTPGDLPEALRTQRAWSGRTQAELAARVGCSADAVRAWERGRAVPSASFRARLEEAYGLGEEALVSAFPRTPTPAPRRTSHRA
jgi:transcriptional regulator with XRE-family HTH domain